MISRLDKFISATLAVSRSDAKKIISDGKVTLNGKTSKDSSQKVNSDCDTVEFMGKPLTAQQYVYIMLNKPAGIVSASNGKNCITVVDLVKDSFPNRALFPAGRLDKTSTGFVLITDDGAFAHNILAPKHHVPKTYIVDVDAPITDKVIYGFANGVKLADGTVMKSATIKPISDDKLQCEIVLRQGVYHQIKRMLGVYDIGVNKLHRTAIGNLKLSDNLNYGEYVQLSQQQLELIYDFKTPE